MARILLRRVPKRTDKTSQQKAMKVWASVIVEEYAHRKNVPIIAASEYRAKAEKTISNKTIKKTDPI